MAPTHNDAPNVPKELAMRSIFIALLSIALAGPAVAADSQPPAKLPSEMTPAEIKAHNAGLDRSDPYYITCRKTEVLGSLAKKERVCRTTEKWKEANAHGNEGTRDMVEGMARSGGTSGN
jgi:hypothetical protein